VLELFGNNNGARAFSTNDAAEGTKSTVAAGGIGNGDAVFLTEICDQLLA